MTAALIPLGITCPAQQPGVGARALAMGGAYTAIADDQYAAYWNPAGAAQVKEFRVSAFSAGAQLSGANNLFDLIDKFPASTGNTSEDYKFADRFGRGVSKLQASGDIGFVYRGFGFSIIPFASGTLVPHDALGNIGFKYVNIGGQLKPAAGSYATGSAVAGYEAVATFAHGVGPRTSAGINLKIASYRPYQLSLLINDPTLNIATATTHTGATTTAFAADIGVLHRPVRDVTVGATVRNLFKPNGDDALPRTLTVGAAYHPARQHIVVAADLDDLAAHPRLNVGTEYSLGKVAALRAGIYRGQPTLGIGLFRVVDVAYGTNQSLLSFSIGF